MVDRSFRPRELALGVFRNGLLRGCEKLEGERGLEFWEAPMCDSMGEDGGSGVVAAVPVESRLCSAKGKTPSWPVD